VLKEPSTESVPLRLAGYASVSANKRGKESLVSEIVIRARPAEIEIAMKKVLDSLRTLCMRRNGAIFSLLLISLAMPCQTKAEWVKNQKIDSMTDKEEKHAMIVNNEGHSFSIYRVGEGGKVWAQFRLASTSLDQLSVDQLPMYRVDKNEAQDLMELIRVTKLMKRLGTPMTFYTQKPKWINFQIWTGSESVCGPSGKKMAEVLDGSKLVIRYWLFTGGFKETEFDISSGRSVILDAIDSKGVKVCDYNS